MERFATSQWRGNLEQGMGLLSVESETLINIPYSYEKRFGNKHGLNPEELIAAALSACFAMAFASELSKRRLIPVNINVKSQIEIDPSNDNWEITKIKLRVFADVPNANYQEIERAAIFAKENCPVSKLLKSKINLELTIRNHSSGAEKDENTGA